MKRLAFFADGTWNRMEPDGGTNVQKLFNLTRQSPGQLKKYDEGLGTGMWNRIRGGAFGMGISENIKDGYRFLIDAAWQPGDEIFLIGFSRGAYTVRSLAGWLNFVGLVTKQDDALIDAAYDLYRQKKEITGMNNSPVDPKKKKRYDDFLAANVPPERRAVKIKMVGVWDTVGSLGIPQNWLNEHLNPFQHGFHDTTLGANVQNAYHAVAIDEKRKSFLPALWPQDDPRVHQVYFCGVHSDVGGGYNTKPEDRILGDITLRWMAEGAKKVGLDVDLAGVPAANENEYCGLQHESWKGKWTLVRAVHRVIAAGARIHPSVRKRYEEARKDAFHKLNPPPYRPPELKLPPFDKYKWE